MTLLKFTLMEPVEPKTLFVWIDPTMVKSVGDAMRGEQTGAAITFRDSELPLYVRESADAVVNRILEVVGAGTPETEKS